MNIQGFDGETALMEASCSNALQCMKILIQAGADVNSQNYKTETALINAVLSDSV